MSLPLVMAVLIAVPEAQASVSADTFAGPPAPRVQESAPAPPVNLRASIEAVLERKVPRWIEAERRRLGWASGLFGLGGYRARGADGDFGYKVPPLSVFPRAGLGQSLNVDPLTGKPY